MDKNPCSSLENHWFTLKLKSVIVHSQAVKQWLKSCWTFGKKLFNCCAETNVLFGQPLQNVKEMLAQYDSVFSAI